MGVRWLLFVAVLAASLGGLALGAWLGKKSVRAATIAVATGLLFVLLRALMRYVPPLEHALGPSDLYAVAHPWWAFPFAFLLLGAGARHMSTANGRKLVGVFAGLLLLVALQRLWITARFDPTTMHAVVRPDGVCIQSTDYTCGAAAAAMLLHQVGVTTTEREMAGLCWTNGLTGTDELGVCMGLRRKLAGRGLRPALVTSDWDDLRRRGGPAMGTIKHSFMIDHWVLVLEVRERDLVVLDPLKGRHVLPRAQFLSLWRRGLVVLEPS